MKPGANPTNHLAWCTRGWKEGREDRKEKASEEAGARDQGLIGRREGGRAAARVAVHSVASIMQRHGVFAFP